ncbi:unnamed protein product [Scytosiphon promiscuus]
MKLTGSFLLALGVTPFAQLACAQAIDDRAMTPVDHDTLTLTRFAEEDVTDVGVGEFHPIGSDEEEIEQDLVDSLEASGQTTVVEQVELGELLCGSLGNASGATKLRFAISSTETVIAERTSYSTVDGSALPDGKGRKLWMGTVVDPEPPAGSIPRTVSMSWTDPCEVESFLLKVVQSTEDNHSSIVKSVPCAAGSSNELCMVELDVVFASHADPLVPELDEPVDDEIEVPVIETLPPVDAEFMQLQGQELQQMPSQRRLQGTTEIDVLVLYSTDTFAAGEETQWVTNIVVGFLTANEATTNSGIDLKFNLVRVDQLPYSQSSTDSSVELPKMAQDADVQALRDDVQADLVLLVGNFPGTCGLGYIFNGWDGFGYSLIDDDCFDNHSHTHEMAHNLGCFHDRDNSNTQTDYSHGWRYCTGDVQYRTIMGYTTGCVSSPGRINYFSNPDISYLGLPTGTATADNARRIEDTMVAVSNFRAGVVATCAEVGETCTTAADCCSDYCGSAGVCATNLCDGQGGDVSTIGDSVCDPGNNVEACYFDSGDCCDCDCAEPACGGGDDECTTPAWNCVDSPSQVGQSIRGYGQQFCSTITADDLGDCDYFGGATCDCTCVESGGDLTCGTEGYNCIDPDSACGPTPCATSADCTLPEECCPVKLVCEVPDTTDPLACGDPHMTGFRGQTFDFTGEDGEWYCLISDLPSMHLNMRVTTPVPSLPEITYITGLSVVTTDAEGFDHSIVIEVTNPHSLDSACPVGVSPCLADGALSVFIDGSEELLQPGTVSPAPGVSVSVVNLPGECRSFGFEQYWERKTLEYAQAAGRRLTTQSMGEWVLGDPTATNMAECMEYVEKATASGDAGLFEHQSEHASFQVVMPTATIRLSHGRLHQLPMRDPTDRFDLPDHTTWQMNMAVDHNDVGLEATGVLGETLVPTVDDSGMPIMQGMGAIRGSQEDYRVEGPLGVYFVQGKSD